MITLPWMDLIRDLEELGYAPAEILYYLKLYGFFEERRITNEYSIKSDKTTYDEENN